MSDEMKRHQDERGTVRELTVHDSPPQNGTAERGMRTRAEGARALLLASGLPRFLWEEAMRHTTWLQNRTPTRALDGKTPYEMRSKKKPHLAGIQEFGMAAYVKDLKAGKLDARAKIGRFVGYDSESKGYRIYWPGKRSVTVERNVTFDEKDLHSTENHAIIPGDVLSEGEREKVIQHTKSNIVNTEEPGDDTVSGQAESKEKQEPQPSNSIPFPSTPEQPTDPAPEPEDDSKASAYGHGQ